MGEARTQAPKHDVVVNIDQDHAEQIQEYADQSGITFDEAVNAFASRGIGKVKREVRKTLRQR